ncbi:MAG: ABC transporter ATP-binding protein [Planctomycetota bacterium]|nr:ABC transporter ATP-binding protein [Planctomycetota bacterium]
MIRTKGLTILYGKLVAVRNLDLEVPKGEIFGLIGPNGAGKSSTLRALATIQELSWGTATIAGLDIDNDWRAVHKIVGFMPDFFSLYDELQVWEYLDHFASAYRIPRRQRKRSIDEVIELTDLQVKTNALVGTLSRGMKQRLLLAKTLIHDPEVLLLDEPASGLDPKARIELRGIVRTLAQMGKTVVISSHILTELSEICTSVGIMEKGELRLAGRVDEITHMLTPHTTVEVDLIQNPPGLEDRLREKKYVLAVRLRGEKLEIDLDGDREERADLAQTILGAGGRFAAFEVRKENLEDLFIRITGGGEVS